MTINIACELNGLRVSADINTLNVESHSAITEIPKSDLEQVKLHIFKELQTLVSLADQHRKVTG